MRLPQFKFSVRTLLIAFAVFSALLALSIRFGPHVFWKTLDSDISSGVVPIPSNPLVATVPDETLVTCRIGPVSFELPKSMSRNTEVHRGIGGALLQLHNGNRSIALQLPKPDDQLLQQEILEFPDKAKLTFPRLYKEIADAQSSDFSFGMSHRELRWHKWLLSTRSQIGIDIDSIEFLWRPDLEGNLISLSSVRTFQWATVDCKWEGTIYFKGTSHADVEWIRHLCTTFVINGNPNIFNGRDDATIESMITITESDDPTTAQ